MNRISNRDAVGHITARAEFTSHTGSLRGTGINDHTGLRVPRVGMLPQPYAADFFAARPLTRPGLESTDLLYVVFSYGTPIAWFTQADGWVIPDVKYSVTTSRHQGIVRQAVSA